MKSLPWTLAWARLRNHRLRTFSILISVSLALLALLTLQGIAHSTGNALVTYELSKLPAGDRTLTLTSVRIISSPDEYRAIDTYLSSHLSTLTSGRLTPELLYHEVSDVHGVGFYFAGVDGLSKSIRITTGRLPTQCTAALCEVIQVGGQGLTPPRPESLGIKIVGTGVFLNKQLFSGTLAPTDGAPILVADGIAPASTLSHFSNLQGTNGWVATMNLDRIASKGADTYINSILTFENQLSIDHSEVQLTWPQDALGGASDKSKGISDKFVLLDFVVGALLLAFLILFSLRHRREHLQFRSGLSRIGTPKKTLILELLIEIGVPVVLGAIVAFVISLLVPTALHVTHFQANLFQIYQGWPKYFSLIAAALSLIFGMLIFGDKAWGRATVLPLIFGALFLLAYLRGSGTQEIRFWLVPLAYVVIPSLIGYTALRAASIFWRNKHHQTYVLFREHLSMWQGVAAILTLASILAVIALSFASGISKDVTARSRDQVPLDVSLRTGPDLSRPLDLGGIPDYESLVNGSKAYAILRSGTAVRNESSVSDTLSLIGVPPSALRAMPDSSLRQFASTITPASPIGEQGVGIGSTSTIAVTLNNIPKEIDLIAWFLTPRGTHLSAIFTGHTATRTLSLAGQIPPRSSLIAFEFRETSDYLSRRLHAMGEGSFAVPMIKGTGGISAVAFDGIPQLIPNKSWHLREFPYEFNGGSLYVRPTITDVIPRVLVDPITAALATHGILTLTGATGDFFQVAVGAVAKSFPSAGDRFVIMDLNQLQVEIAKTDLGATDPIELWISTPNSRLYLERLANSPFNTLEATSQHDVASALRSDPVNIGLNGAYRVAFFYALLLAIFMYFSALPLLYKEGKNVLFQLEASGVGPKQLRRSFRESLRLVVLVALTLGGSLGLVVGHWFISGSTPYITVISALVIAISLAEVGSYLATRGFFGEPTLARNRP